MLPDRVSNPGPLTYESGALPIALRRRSPIGVCNVCQLICIFVFDVLLHLKTNCFMLETVAWLFVSQSLILLRFIHVSNTAGRNISIFRHRNVRSFFLIIAKYG